MTAVAAEADTTDEDSARTRVANARARLALVGVVLHVADADNGRPFYVVIEGALTRTLSDLAELEAWTDLRSDGRAGAIA